YGTVPAFWSAQGDLNIKSIGLTDGADALVIAQGDPKTGRFLALYGRQGICIAAVSFDRARWLSAYTEAIARKAPFPPIRGAVEQGDLALLDPGFDRG
ncbi:oxidoreductase C-terminal domain-containing protein, partial [Klebsiella pneumoniae]|uniref:oxidoreductase C-terminal domain-containing protein n=1 Tax=Klebsiella pneumoniae TaxID=573 RepID=UPI001E2A74E1